jgi:hypothetical protein
VQGLWKMTPLGLKLNEGSDETPSQISLHNYYSNAVGDWSAFVGFKSIHKGAEEEGDYPYWNPIAALPFQSPEKRISSALSLDFATFYEDFSLITVPYIYDDGIETPVADEDNFLFGNTIHSYASVNGALPNQTNSAPVRLKDKGENYGYLPFYYNSHSSNSNFRSRSNSVGIIMEWVGWEFNDFAPAPLVVGGAGFNAKIENQFSVDRSDPLHISEISNITTSVYQRSNNSSVGFRCLFSLVNAGE